MTKMAAREDFYERLGPDSLAPLWKRMSSLVPPEPRNPTAPFAWRYARIRPLLLEAGALVTAEEAQRRVLVFENPSFRGSSRINSTLYAGAQLILPGETVRAHRHTASAVRFILEGDGGYTTVDEERIDMKRADLVITPKGAFHDHGHEGSGPCIWVDVLDVPIVNYFETSFCEEADEPRRGISKRPGHSLAEFGSGMLPMEFSLPLPKASPLVSYPYARARAALLELEQSRAADMHTGYSLRYANPIDGGWVTPTIACWLVRLPKGFTTAPYRATDNQGMVVSEGQVSVEIGGARFDLATNDTLALPGWTWRTLSARDDVVLFFFSDRSAQEKLGIWRQEKANAR